MKFLCPECGLLLEKRVDNLICECGNAYKIIDGIPVFSKIDSFYEGAWKDTLTEDVSSFGKFLYINFSKDTRTTRYRLIRKCLKKHSNSGTQSILDLGCGGGNDIFSKKGTAVGADISFGSLKNAKNIYHQCVQIDITKPLPFENESFDFISSEEVFEHIEHKNKDNLIRDVRRVLKKGGRALFIFETTGLFYKLARLKSGDYKKYLAIKYGHVGLETPGEAIERFKKSGLRILKIEKHFSLFYPMGMLLEYLDTEYIERSFFLRKILRIIRFILKFPRLTEIVNFCAGVLQETLEAFLPVNAAGTLCILCRK